MLIGVLRTPFDLAMRSEITRRQFHDRAKQAADRIENDAAEIARLTAKLKQVRDSLRYEYELVERDSLKFAECAYHVPAFVISDLADEIDATIAARSQP